MPKFRALLLVLMLAAVGPLASALGPDAEQAFLEGRYAAAIDLTRTPKSADDAAFCARVLLAQAITSPDEPDRAVVQDGLNMANFALNAQSNHIEGRLQKAIALSLLTRPMSLGEARRSGYGQEARDLAESVLVDDPDNEYAHGFLAVWHLEVMRRGGRIGAMLMGADVSSAEAHYLSATAVAPDDASVHWQYARALTALNARKHRTDIDRALDAAIIAKVDSRLEATMQHRAVLLREKLSAEGNDRAQEWAAGIL